MISTHKNKLRQQARLRRQALSSQDVLRRSRNIAEMLQNEIQWTALQTVHTYLPIKRQKEISTWPLIDWLHLEHPHIEIYAPFGANINLAFKVQSDMQFSLDSLGMPQPVSTTPQPIKSHYDLIIIPCMAASPKTKFRLGYGHGNYDRFLSKTGGKTIGLCYKETAYETIPNDQHDVALDRIILG